MKRINNKAVALLSGGLDSMLSVKLAVNQGINVTALNMVSSLTSFAPKGTVSHAQRAAAILGVPLEVEDYTPAMLKMIKNPKHGFGRNLNPCVDCKIYMLKRAKILAEKIGASFIITGEVVGSRPMSQTLERIKLIEKESGLDSLILRPLSAKLLPPSLPETEGAVEREKLMSFSGRSRTPQIELAELEGINQYPSPAGGCLLTDRDFSLRLKKLLKKDENPSSEKINILKYGRLFEIGDNFIIIGRNELQNEAITALASNNDILMEVKDFKGPVSLIQGKTTRNVIEKAAHITARYSKAREEKQVQVVYWFKNGPVSEVAARPEEGYSLIKNYREEN